MAESNHDDLADALARLAGGDVAPSERDHEPAPLAPPPPPVPAKIPVARPTFRPTTPNPAPPGGRAPAPPVPRAPAPVARPAAPVRPAAPAVAPPPGVARPQRPLTPTIRPVAPTLSAPPPPEEPPVDDAAQAEFDDDAVIVPAPDASVFIPKKKPATSAEARARVARRKQLDFRRTIIPILLTTGVLTIGFGIAPKFLGADSIAANVPSWVTPALAGIGLVLLALAAVNMVSVRAMLLADAAEATR